MATLPIHRMGSDLLKARASEVQDFSAPALPMLIQDMIETMAVAHGVGLAAPQVGASQRIVVFFVPGPRNGGVEIPLTIMINPIIEPLAPDQEEGWEACLSVPGLTGRVPRWTSIRYSFQDLQGVRHDRRADGFHARVVQHECDHLDGVLYPMRMTDLSTLAYADVLHEQAVAAGETLDLDEEEIVPE
jgi:peptide deformylase